MQLPGKRQREDADYEFVFFAYQENSGQGLEMIRFNVWFLLELYGCWMELALVSSGWFVFAALGSGQPFVCSCSWLAQRSSLLPLEAVGALLPGGGLGVLLHPRRPVLSQQETEGGHPQVRGRRAAAVTSPTTVTTLNSCLLVCFRINVGGKLLTNHLKEIISYRFVFSGSDEPKTNRSCFHIIFLCFQAASCDG